MTKPFKDLLNKMPSERRERIKIKTDILKNEMALGELRQALDLTQEDIANTLGMKQAAISKFEHQSDIYLSTLRKILFAMGADLQVVAHFPDGNVLIDQFKDVRCDADSKRKLAVS